MRSFCMYVFLFFFFNDTATTEIYTLSLHDALPIYDVLALKEADCGIAMANGSDATRAVAQLVLLDSNFSALPQVVMEGRRLDRKSTRLNSSHANISYAVFCLKKKKIWNSLPYYVIL